MHLASVFHVLKQNWNKFLYHKKCDLTDALKEKVSLPPSRTHYVVHLLSEIPEGM